MTFHGASLRLTLYYLLIIMFISVLFSTALYRVLTNELDRIKERQQEFLHSPALLRPLLERPSFDTLLVNVDASKKRLIFNLFYYNLIILGLGGVASYGLARRTLRPIEESVEAQSRFTADASHELRTPLTAMRTEIEVTLRDKAVKARELRELLKSNLEEIVKLEELSNGLLHLAEHENQDRLIFEQVPLNETVLEAVRRITMIAKKRGIIVKADLTSEQVIPAFRQRLVELWIILLDNAVKYSQNSQTVLIKTGHENRYATIMVQDSGVGINATDIPHIFDRFYRADRSRSKEKINGYGLGLSIAEKIVELHNGKISVKSRPGKGSTFIVRLPLHREWKIFPQT